MFIRDSLDGSVSIPMAKRLALINGIELDVYKRQGQQKYMAMKL